MKIDNRFAVVMVLMLCACGHDDAMSPYVVAEEGAGVVTDAPSVQEGSGGTQDTVDDMQLAPAAPAPMQEPHADASVLANMDLRQFVSYGDELLRNLAANPSLRRGVYSHISLHAVVKNMSDTSELNALDALVQQAQALDPPMPIYPSTRLFASAPFSDWVNPTYWQQRADDIAVLAAHRPAGERRIGLDCEAYGSGIEVSEETLAAAGYTVAQFRQAIAPLIDRLVALDASVTFYPAFGTTPGNANQLSLALLEALGPQNVELWWQASFSIAEQYRTAPNSSFLYTIRKIRDYESGFNRIVGRHDLRHRHSIADDVLRAWGKPFLAELDAMGTFRPWIFDTTRVDRPQWGTEAAYRGRSVRSVNDVQHAWVFEPGAATIAASAGIAEQSVVLQPYRGGATSYSVGDALARDFEGLRLRSEDAVFTSAFLRANALPPPGAGTAWLIDFEFQIPSAIANDTPILAQAASNYGYWQLYFNVTTQQLVLQIDAPGAAPRVEYVVLSGVQRDTDIRLQLGRNGDREWVYSAGAAPVSRVDPGFVVPTREEFLIGAGQLPATFPTNNTVLGMRDLLLRKQLLVWWRNLSDAELTQVKAGAYPFGRGT